MVDQSIPLPGEAVLITILSKTSKITQITNHYVSTWTEPPKLCTFTRHNLRPSPLYLRNGVYLQLASDRHQVKPLKSRAYRDEVTHLICKVRYGLEAFTPTYGWKGLPVQRDLGAKLISFVRIQVFKYTTKSPIPVFVLDLVDLAISTDGVR